MNEAQLSKKIIDRINTIPMCFAVKIVGHPMQRGGIPDIHVTAAGASVWIETKLPGKLDTLTKRQDRMLRRFLKAGGYAAVCTSVEQAVRLVQDAVQDMRDLQDAWNSQSKD